MRSSSVVTQATSLPSFRLAPSQCFPPLVSPFFNRTFSSASYITRLPCLLRPSWAKTGSCATASTVTPHCTVKPVKAPFRRRAHGTGCCLSWTREPCPAEIPQTDCGVETLHMDVGEAGGAEAGLSSSLPACHLCPGL